MLGAGLYGLLRAEAQLARRAIGEPGADNRPPESSGWYGRGRPGPAIRLALLGDSSAAGYGVERVEDTPGAQLASGVATQAHRRVHLREFAKVGAKTSDLLVQIESALPTKPDVAVILIGANDVTHSVLPSQSVQHLAEGVRLLREHGVAVVVGTCPDLGTIKPIAPPLKQVARSWSRRLAAAQTIAVVEAGGRTVALASILGPEFAAAPAVLFGPDQFHPSADGYQQLASVLIPSCLAELGPHPRGRGAARGLPRRGRAAGRGRRRPRRQDARHRARRHRGRRRPARACAVAGSSCGTVAVTRARTSRHPRSPTRCSHMTTGPSSGDDGPAQ